MKKILFIILFFASNLWADMVAVNGNITCDNATIRDIIYNWIVNKATSTWNKQSYIPIKSDIVAVGTTSAHYDLYCEFRIINQSLKNYVKNYVKDLKLNSHIINMDIWIHKCNNDIDGNCSEIERVLK